MNDNILYEHCYYLMRQTIKPKYLDFYDLEQKDLAHIECYLEQTVRYKNAWYFIETRKKYFRTKEEKDKATKFFVKKLYKKPEVLVVNDF